MIVPHFIIYVNVLKPNLFRLDEIVHAFYCFTSNFLLLLLLFTLIPNAFFLCLGMMRVFPCLSLRGGILFLSLVDRILLRKKTTDELTHIFIVLRGTQTNGVNAETFLSLYITILLFISWARYMSQVGIDLVKMSMYIVEIPKFVCLLQ